MFLYIFTCSENGKALSKDPHPMIPSIKRCHNIVKLVVENEFISGVNIIHVPVLININSHPHFPKNIGVGRPTINILTVL